MTQPVGSQSPAETGSNTRRAASAGGDETGTLGSRPSGSDTPVFGPASEPGEIGTLGPYRVLKELGRGGMGAVYAALDTRLDRKLALKVMLPQLAADAAARERFLREARAIARIKHDNVVVVYEADERHGVPYIAMEYLEGSALDAYLKRKGNLTVLQALRVVREAVAGLGAAHARGLVHRDVKPGNLWLEAPCGRVKVLDFGLAKPLGAGVELTHSGAIVGTPAYMSPEQARGEKVDHRTDLFSLGAVLYRLCTGQLPFQGPTAMAVLMALGVEEPPPVRELNPAVPESLAGLIHQLLAKKADARPQTAAEVARRLDAVEDELTAPQARPADGPSTSLPQVVAVTAPPPAADPFADIEADSTEREPAQPAESKSVRKSPGGKAVWAAVGVGALLAAVATAVIVGKNRSGSEAKGEVKDEAPAAAPVKDRAAAPPRAVPPEKQPVPENGVDRKAAEYVISIGGYVQVDGEEEEIRAATGLPKGGFRLTGANLKDNRQVTDAGLAKLAGCAGLTYLYLGGTPVTDAGLAYLKDLTGLTKLYLGSTRVTDTGLGHFNRCSGLATLHLWGTPITGAGLVHFKDCKGLKELALGRTSVGDDGLAHLKGCTGLTSLYLSFTKVTDTGLAYFKDCKGLTYLNMTDTAVTDAGLAHFKGCKGLTYLGLGGTRVTDTGLSYFAGCTGLTELHLPNTGVTDAGLDHFKGCAGLAELVLNDTKVTAQWVREFHAAVPGCRIRHQGRVIGPK